MVQALPRTSVRGSTFIRLLARLTGAEVAPSHPSLPDRLSHWLDWTHALALSTALDGRAAEPELGAPAFGSADEEEYARLRAVLVEAITLEQDWTQPPRREASSGGTVDYAVFRQRYITLQRRMQSTTGHLRGRLRDRLSQRGGDDARLAEVDAVMERSLTPREHMLMAAVPGVLGDHFERLRGAQAESGDGETAATAWIELFLKDMQSVLLAELDVRFQPVESLLAALRTR